MIQIANVLAPSVQILKSRILEARDRFEAMDATDDQLARILVRAERLAVRMAAAFSKAKVADWEPLEPTMTMTPKDRHLAAAALQAERSTS